MENCLDMANLGEAHTSGCKVDSEELGHVKGLTVILSSLKLWVAQLFFTPLDAAKEVVEGQVEPLGGLLEGLGVGILEKGMVLFEICEAIVEVVPA